MNKKTLTNVFLILLPAMATVLATTGDSVHVYDVPAGTAQSYSYFSLVPVASVQLCTPLAAMLAVTAAVLALGFVFGKKHWCLQAEFYCACASTCLAACPNLVRGDILVIPNVMFPLLMAVLGLLANAARKEKEETPNGKRLEKRA